MLETVKSKQDNPFKEQNNRKFLETKINEYKNFLTIPLHKNEFELPKSTVEKEKEKLTTSPTTAIRAKTAIGEKR